MGFAEFIRERQFLANVSPSTLEWYKHSFKWLESESPSQEDLKAAVLPNGEPSDASDDIGFSVKSFRFRTLCETRYQT